MSYSFNVRGATLALALAAAAVEMDKVVAAQPAHAKDAAPALAAAEAFGNLIVADENKDVAVQINGWVTWKGGAAEPSEALTGVTASVSVTLVPKL